MAVSMNWGSFSRAPLKGFGVDIMGPSQIKSANVNPKEWGSFFWELLYGPLMVYGIELL